MCIQLWNSSLPCFLSHANTHWQLWWITGLSSSPRKSQHFLINRVPHRAKSTRETFVFFNSSCLPNSAWMCTHTQRCTLRQTDTHTHKMILSLQTRPLTLVFHQLYADSCELMTEDVFALLVALCLCVCVSVCVGVFELQPHFNHCPLTSRGNCVLVCTICSLNQGEMHKSPHLNVVSLRSSLSVWPWPTLIRP